MLTLLLLLGPAWADQDAYQTCCDTLDAGNCPRILEVLGPGTIGETNKRATTVTGLWMLSCDDGAAWFPAARRSVPPGQQPGAILQDVSDEAVACFTSACSMPVRLCLADQGGINRIVDCETRESALRSAWLDTRLDDARTLPLQSAVPVETAVARTPRSRPSARQAPARPTTTVVEPARTPEPVPVVQAPKAQPPVAKPAPATKPAPVVTKPAPVVTKPAPVVTKPAPPVVAEPVQVVSTPTRPIIVEPPRVIEPAQSPPARTAVLASMPDEEVDFSLPNPPPDPCVVQPHLRQPSIDQVELGDESVVTNMPGKAMGHYRAALTINPCNPFAWAQLGSTMLEGGAPAPAATALEYATRLMPKHFRAWTELGKVRERQGEWTMAIEAYQEALTHRPGYVAAEAGLRRSIRSR